MRSMKETEIENYKRNMVRSVRQSYHEFHKGELPQASEKMWKAICIHIMLLSGVVTAKHSDLRELAKKIGEEDMHMFTIGESLHANFYHDVFDVDVVIDGMNQIKHHIAIHRH